MIIFIGCVKTKNKGLLKAVDKYNSNLFKKRLQYARLLTDDIYIYILSAKYGLIKLDDYINDYDVTLNSMNEKDKKIWAYNVIKKAEKFNIKKNDEIIFLCGNNYSKYLKRYYNNYKDPTYGLSLGYELQWYNQRISSMQKPTIKN